jgi:hypothetical protein
MGAKAKWGEEERKWTESWNEQNRNPKRLALTAQVYERLILNGKETDMSFCPPLPEGNPRIVTLSDEEARQRVNAPGSPTYQSMVLNSTACWRHYRGCWEVKDGRFYLTALEGKYRLVGTEPLLADWFTGVIRIPRGKLLHYVHMGFGSVYEEELHIKIVRGIVTKTRTIDNREKKLGKLDELDIVRENLPGNENRFPGDEDL